MIGRGTRLCPNLFGEGQDKKDFRIFDFCGNFDFFNEHPEGFTTTAQPSLSHRLIMLRATLLKTLQAGECHDPNDQTRPNDKVDTSVYNVCNTLQNDLLAEINAMNTDNFMVRQRLHAVEKCQQPEYWKRLDEDKLSEIESIASLPSELQHDDIESRLLDNTAFQLQLALLEGEHKRFDGLSKKIISLAVDLSEKQSVPAIKNKLDYLADIQTVEFWQDVTIEQLEEMRLILRPLAVFVDKKQRPLIEIDIDDPIIELSDLEEPPLPAMTGEQYYKMVESYLKTHLSQPVIHKIYTNQVLTAYDVTQLEQILVELADDGDVLLSDLLAGNQAQNVLVLVRKVIGLDRASAEAPFQELLQTTHCNEKQIHFISKIIEQLTTNGILEAADLYEAPFTKIHHLGVDDLFANNDNVLEEVFERLERTKPVVA